jgi:hypothetical protein
MLHVVRAGDGPLTCPGIPAGGHGLLPQLQARERAAHTGTVSEQCLEPNRARFSRQLKRISVQMDSVVRVSPPQPASPVSVGDVRFAKIGATYPRVSETSRKLRGAIFCILGDIRPIARASLWSPIFNIRV